MTNIIGRLRAYGTLVEREAADAIEAKDKEIDFHRQLRLCNEQEIERLRREIEDLHRALAEMLDAARSYRARIVEEALEGK